jgi:hypothetical protein
MRKPVRATAGSPDPSIEQFFERLIFRVDVVYAFVHARVIVRPARPRLDRQITTQIERPIFFIVMKTSKSLQRIPYYVDL